MSAAFKFFTFLSFLPPLTTGFLMVSVFWHKDRPILSDLPLKCCLSVGFGYGASSCFVFVWMMVVGRLTRGMLFCEWMLPLGLCALLVWRKRASISTAASQPESISIPSFKSPYLLRSAACFAAISAAFRFWCVSRQDPHGQFDAYAIWNLRARFLYRGGQYWKNFIYMTETHTDYPLLLPASIARSWEFIGRETQLIPSAIALLFTFATIGIVFASISRFRGERQGLLAGLILLGTPFLIVHGASQYADVPLSFFFVATLALLFLHAESPAHMRFLILAGMAAAFSAWTKNEGILFLVLLFLLHFVVTTLAKGRKRWSSEVIALLLGAAPVSVVIFIYRMCLGSSNDIIAAQGPGFTIRMLLDISRYRLVMSHFEWELLRFGGWSATFGMVMPLLLFFYFLLLGTNVNKKDVAATSIAVLLPTFMMIGYFFVYILSPHDLAWHLDTSLNRLLLQVWPLVIFAYFAIVQSPERAVTAYMHPASQELRESGAFDREALMYPAIEN
jgi:4-amino-4-deoxy-L-arabinose transferase-like glycosyltransferase